MSDLNDFLKKKLEEKTKKEFNAEEEKKKWITSADEIINNIRKWVEEPVKNNLVELIDEEVEINEERLGKYKINSLAIRSLWDTVYIRPIGRMILGAIGRIDILSTKGKYSILLTVDNGWVVKLDGVYKVFNEELFAGILKVMMS
ncbi:MAG: hypothetical protein Q607_CBUC00182G0098 [Clostridium butyricum DORA_1]|jgi:hypothetical protein|uniref:hypothetical protein n=1 Tax=Clostridium butyricum TaxID=1492 RepID=UPI0003D61537|nr:hypothetical protein [Clostridium butyricum]ETI89118.1 MAG: hypothetical protein Q607_CBUC00182G0098 [Clostridium butyricum DORA_1]MDU1506660.1 hypothetical protein [Clostridium butyricum]MDU4800960.1 hypothetical protein [Clostridium butyricum]RQN12294.1 hypothetical protein EHW71_03495 [Clostridium butyricum]